MFCRTHPSKRYLELIAQYRRMHEEGARGRTFFETYAGLSLLPHVKPIGWLCRKYEAMRVLDYGAGKGMQYVSPHNASAGWGVEVTCYDPAYEPFSLLPWRRFDGVVCTDVLEHIPEEDVPWVLREIFSFALKFIYLSIACYPAKKVLPNGENAHCTSRDHLWWVEHILAAYHDNKAALQGYGLDPPQWFAWFVDNPDHSRVFLSTSKWVDAANLKPDWGANGDR